MDIPKFLFCLSQSLEYNCESTKFKPEDFMPMRTTTTDTGWDVRCSAKEGIDLVPCGYLKIPLGFRVFSPPGWWLKLVPRSSTLIKKHIHALYGTIDNQFEGEFHFCGQYIPDRNKIITSKRNRIEFGDRIAQIIPVKLEEMSCEQVSAKEFSKLCAYRNSARGEGGFGSSGN